jgi:hypothetical protein
MISLCRAAVRFPLIYLFSFLFLTHRSGRVRVPGDRVGIPAARKATSSPRIATFSARARSAVFREPFALLPVPLCFRLSPVLAPIRIGEEAQTHRGGGEEGECLFRHPRDK